MPDIYARARGRVRIYQANPEPGCVITYMYYTLQRLTLRKVEGTSRGSDDCSEMLH